MSNVLWSGFAAVAIWAAYSVARPQPTDNPLVASESRPSPVPVTPYGDALTPDVPLQLNAADAEVAAFAKSIADDLLLDFEVDGIRRRS